MRALGILACRPPGLQLSTALAAGSPPERPLWTLLSRVRVPCVACQASHRCSAAEVQNETRRTPAGRCAGHAGHIGRAARDRVPTST